MIQAWKDCNPGDALVLKGYTNKKLIVKAKTEDTLTWEYYENGIFNREGNSSWHAMSRDWCILEKAFRLNLPSWF